MFSELSLTASDILFPKCQQCLVLMSRRLSSHVFLSSWGWSCRTCRHLVDSILGVHSILVLLRAGPQVPLIKEKLGQGITLVVDRYAFSGVAFTSAKEVSATSPSLCCAWRRRPRPARSEFGQERYEDRAFQEQVLRRFHQLQGDTSLNWKVSGRGAPAANSSSVGVLPCCSHPSRGRTLSPCAVLMPVTIPSQGLSPRARPSRMPAPSERTLVAWPTFVLAACASPSTCICAPCPPRLCCAVQLCCHGQAPCEKGPCAAPSTSWTSQSPPCAQMVDASRSIEEVHQEICTLSKDTIQAAAQRPLGELWK
ncbi:hypothetical protein CB1_000575014 [Camelus ferus]|nr:hypothetical protein CB1_000575014 [Camelus ferus]